MDEFLAVLGPVHAVLGFVGLAAFWVPVLSRKGGPRHVLFGRVFLYSAYAALATAGLAVVSRTLALLTSGKGPGAEPVTFALLLFLGYLALVTFVTVHHGIGVLRTKRDPDTLATPVNIGLGRAAMIASLVLVAYAFYFRPPVMAILLALSPVGFFTGYGVLKYLRGDRPTPRQWFYEHMGSMLGGGIAFHTAFAVFGVTRLFDYRLGGWLGVLPWVLPAAIGIPGSVIWRRHYQKKFGELRAAAVQGREAA